MSNPTTVISDPTAPSKIKTILLAVIIAGTLDIVAAIVIQAYILHRTTPIRLLQGIASGAFGKSAFEGGWAMALIGLGFHFFIVFSFTLFYSLIFPYLSFLHKQRVLSGLIYGIFVWCVMNLAVLPLLHIANIPHKWDAIVRGAVVLMFCVGLPISLIVSRYYTTRNTTE
jgi:hypothetical protein